MKRKNQGFSYRHQVQRVPASETVLGYLSRVFSHSSSEQWCGRMEQGEIELDGIRLRQDCRVTPGMVIVWHRPGWVEASVPQTYEILFEDSHVLALNKPSGLPTLPGGGFYWNTLLHMVQVEHPEVRPLHRLGRGTSGVVLFAKTELAVRGLSQQWAQVSKHYRALGSHVAQQTEFDIRVPIGPIEHPRLGRVFAASSHGKAAHSMVQTLETRQDSTLFEVDLRTGRPHQIRIHLAAVGHPLVGDPMYAMGGGLTESPGLPGDLGYLLHAARVEFEHPVSSQSQVVEAPPPRMLCRQSRE